MYLLFGIDIHMVNHHIKDHNIVLNVCCNIVTVEAAGLDYLVVQPNQILQVFLQAVECSPDHLDYHQRVFSYNIEKFFNIFQM